LGLFEYSRRALVLVWTTNKTLSITLAGLTLLAGILPAGIAFMGSLIVDAVIHAAALHARTGATPLADVVTFCRDRSRAGGGHLPGSARHLARAIAAARATRPTRQRDDPREGADAGFDAIRRLRIL
jgi:hypothetical protein